MKVRRILVMIVICGLASLAFGAATAAAAKAPKPPKPKDYTYCVYAETGESECFEAPFEVFHKTHTWTFEETTTGTYTSHGKNYTFKESNGPDELIGTRGKHGVISGRLYENGQPTEYDFTLTPTKG